MRTSYPNPTESRFYYTFKLVDSTFIHAVHYQDRGRFDHKGKVGITFQDDQDTINWYTVNDPEMIYNNLTNPKKSPGFIFNNTLRGKPFTTEKVVDPKPERVEPKKLLESFNKPVDWQVALEGHQIKGKPEMEWKTVVTLGPTKWGPYKPVAPKQEETIKPSIAEFKHYGVLLETCNRQSSCIKYLALGFNKSTKGFVIYYAIDNNTGSAMNATWQRNIRVIETDDASVYRDWINAASLGKHFNKFIRKMDSKHILAR